MSEVVALTVGPGEPDNEKFGSLLWEFRTKLSLSRVKVADHIGVSSEYVRMMEQGKRTPALWTAVKILEFYEVGYTVRVTHSQLFFNNISVKFTSRIKNARYSSPSTRDSISIRSQLLGEIVEFLAVADDDILKKIHSKILQTRE